MHWKLVALTKLPTWVSSKTLLRDVRMGKRVQKTIFASGSVRMILQMDVWWFAREDLLYYCQCLEAQTRPLSFVERAMVPLEYEGLDGVAFYQKVLDDDWVELVLDESVIEGQEPVPDQVKLAQHDQQIRQLTAMLSELMRNANLTPQIPTLRARDIKDLLHRMHVILSRSPNTWNLKEAHSWMEQLLGMSSPHYTSVLDWGNTHPDDAQELCGESRTVLAPFLQLARLLHVEVTRRAREHPSPMLQQEAARAAKVLEETEGRCRVALELQQAIRWDREGAAAVGPTEMALVRLMLEGE